MEATTAEPATAARTQRPLELWLRRRKSKERDDPHHHSPKAEQSRGGAWGLIEVQHSEASNFRGRGTGTQKKSLRKRRKQGEEGSCLGGEVGEEERRAEGGRDSLGSKVEDQGGDRLGNGIAPLAGVPALILLEQLLYTGSFSYGIYFSS